MIAPRSRGAHAARTMTQSLADGATRPTAGRKNTRALAPTLESRGLTLPLQLRALEHDELTSGAREHAGSQRAETALPSPACASHGADPRKAAVRLPRSARSRRARTPENARAARREPPFFS